MDDGFITQATVSVSNEGLVLENPSGLGTCKFRGESYVCQGLSVNHPSHHTVEGVQADGEVTAIFRKPTGELMCMSSLFRINSAQTPSYNFFKQFVPYALTTGETKLTLRDWSISALVPPEASYYVYQGSSLVPPCVPCEWIVFKSMINMDQGDFAYLVRNAEAGSRPVQALGDREVFYNDINNIPGGPMPHDNKFYLRLKPTGSTKMGKLETKKVDLKTPNKQSESDAQQESENPTTLSGKIVKWFVDYTNNYGWYGYVMPVVVLIGLSIGFYAGNKSPYKPVFAESWGITLRSYAGSLWTYLVGMFWSLCTLIYDWTIGWIPFFTNLIARRRAQGHIDSSSSPPISSSSKSSSV
jgi:carbonic anhydrase